MVIDDPVVPILGQTQLTLIYQIAIPIILMVLTNGVNMLEGLQWRRIGFQSYRNFLYDNLFTHFEIIRRTYFLFISNRSSYCIFQIQSLSREKFFQEMLEHCH